MDQESIVYGIIRDVPSSDSAFVMHARLTNCDAILGLGDSDDFPYFTSGMFSIPADDLLQGTYQTQVIHFAASYNSVEYEWQRWVNKFEALLKKMYWMSATVHLETELNGKHTFNWEAPGKYHEPNEQELKVRCEWEHELNFNLR